MRKIFLALSFAAFLTARADFTPVTNGIDYGMINEIDGEQTAKVYLVNSGNDPDQITRVRTTCGCTVAAYDDRQIQPGDTTWVEVTYNPTGRIGKFEKAVKVTDSFHHTINIAVSGLVKPSEETVKSMYPIEVGPLALSTDKIMMADLKLDESKHAFLEVYNNSDSTVSPLFVSDNEAVEVVGAQRDIEPWNFDTFGFFVKTKFAESAGPNKFTVNLYPTGDTNEEPFPIEIYVNITEQE